MNALGFLMCFVVASCPGSYWVSTEATIPIMTMKGLQPPKVSQENITMGTTSNAGKLSSVTTPTIWSPPAPFGSAHSHGHSHGKDLSLIKPGLLL